jgi:hypothetical protein
MWLIIGDFNLIYRAEDKNNDNLDFRLMGLFRRALTSCQLKELKLQNRKFTWSNEREKSYPCEVGPGLLQRCLGP